MNNLSAGGDTGNGQAANPADGAPPVATTPQRSRYERREQASADALRGLIRDHLMEKFPAAMEKVEPMHLTLELVFQPGEPGELRFEPDLRRQVSEQVMALLAPRNAYEEGAVYDFQQESSSAPGCRPPESDAVFAGFDNLGRPRWKSLLQALLDARDARVDQLSAKSPRPLALVQLGKELRSEQLSSHGRANKAYSLLGQMICGPFPVPPAFSRAAGGSRLAITFQLVETRDARGQFALRLNTLAGRLLPREFDDLLQEPSFRHLAAARYEARARVADLESRAREAQNRRDSEAFSKFMRRVPGLLRDFASALENPGTAPARPHIDPRLLRADLAAATADDVLFDSHRNSWVLLGSQGRAHAYSTDGIYLTSFVANHSRLEQRLATGRWKAEYPGREELLIRVRESAGSAS